MDEANVDAAKVEEFTPNDVTSAFMEGSGEEVKAEVKPVEVKPEATEKPVEVKATPEAPPVSGLTTEQQDLLSKIPKLEALMQRVDKVDGNYGEIKRLVTEMQKSAATPNGAVSDEANQAWAELAEVFPELSGSISKGVSSEVEKAVAKAVASIPGGVDPEQLSKIVQEAISSTREKEKTEQINADITALNKAHPDRNECISSPEWSKWLATLPADDREEMLEGWDLKTVKKGFSTFKAWRDQQASSKQKSKQRIEDAVTPQGVRMPAPAAISVHQAFLQGAGEV